MLYENAMQQPTMTVDMDGNKTWRLGGKCHREDGPAIEWAGGDKVWCLNGKWHREDGPAIEYADGTKSWYLHGICHREDGPAREDADGYKAWYLHGKKYEDAFKWAEALLKLKGNKNPSEDEINSKVQQVTSASILD